MNLMVCAIEYGVKNLDSAIDYLEKLGFHFIHETKNSKLFTDNTLVISLFESTDYVIRVINYVDSLEQLDNNPDMLIEESTGRYLFETPFSFSFAFEANTLKEIPELQTMSNSEFDKVELMPNKNLGIFGEFAQPVANIETAIEFMKSFDYDGHNNGKINKEPYLWTIMYQGNMIVGLHNTTDFIAPTTTYFSPKMKDKIELLKEKGIELETIGDDNNARFFIDGRYPIFLFTL